MKLRDGWYDSGIHEGMHYWDAIENNRVIRSFARLPSIDMGLPNLKDGRRSDRYLANGGKYYEPCISIEWVKTHSKWLHGLYGPEPDLWEQDLIVEV